MLVPLSLLSLLVGHTVGSTADFVSSGLDKRFLVDLLGQRDLVHPVKSFWHNHKLFRNNHEIRPAHNNHPEPHKGSAKSHKSKAPKKGRKDLSQSNNASSSAMSLFTDMSGKHCECLVLYLCTACYNSLKDHTLYNTYVLSLPLLGLLQLSGS